MIEVQVRIRRDWDTESRLLASVSLDQLDTVIPIIRSWGIEGEQPELVGQFVIGESGQSSYFEVIVCPEDGGE